jgi:1-acyl-sn-glycerol-3-phosphate acyltransferase
MQERLSNMKEQVYRDPRPAEHFERYHAQTRRGPANAIYDLARMIVSPPVWLLYRARGINAAAVPASDAVIIAPNHFSYLDHFFVGAFIRRKVHFMAKSQLFTWPMQWVYRHGGTFPVRRGARDQEAMKTADAVLERGNAMVMYCEGGRSRSGKVSGEAKHGLGLIALRHGVPVVPVAIYGSQRVRNWKKLQIPKVTVSYGEPLRFQKIAEPTREQAQEASNIVLEEIRTLFAELEAGGRSAARTRVRREKLGRPV